MALNETWGKMVKENRLYTDKNTTKKITNHSSGKTKYNTNST